VPNGAKSSAACRAPTASPPESRSRSGGLASGIAQRQRQPRRITTPRRIKTMSKSFDFRRARPWEVALTVFALSAPLLAPFAAPGTDSFVSRAVAQEMQKIDTSRLVAIGGAVTE